MACGLPKRFEDETVAGRLISPPGGCESDAVDDERVGEAFSALTKFTIGDDVTADGSEDEFSSYRSSVGTGSLRTR